MRLSSATFSAGDIGKIIQNFSSKKARGYENISIWMSKICGNTTDLELVFKQASVTVAYPSDWKKINIVTVYRQISR